MESVPKTMRAWQFTTVKPKNLPASLSLIPNAPVPTPKPNEHLVKISYCSLNSADYKPGESPIARYLLVPNPATPGIDFSGTIIQPADNSNLQPGDRVYGCGANFLAGGCLADYAITNIEGTIPIPAGVSMEHASTIGIAGLTAYQTIVPYIRQEEDDPSSKSLLINGGSGGTGMYGIQIARALGVGHITTTCSSRNVDFCTQLGADMVLDYTKCNIVDTLTRDTIEYDHIVDNVLSDTKLYYAANRYSKSSANFVVVAGGPDPGYIYTMMKMRLWPSWLGGGRRPVHDFLAKLDGGQLAEIGEWMAQGKVRAYVDQKFGMDDVVKAFEKLKTGRTRGKIVVEINPDV